MNTATRNIGWTIEIDRAVEALDAEGLKANWTKTGDGVILNINADGEMTDEQFDQAMADFDAWAEHEAEETEVAAGSAKQEEMETVIGKTIADDQVGGLARLAAEWIDEGFTADEAAEWIKAGGFVARACAELRDAEITVEQASKPASKDDESCSIAYALSNGDIDSDRAIGLVNGFDFVATEPSGTTERFTAASWDEAVERTHEWVREGNFSDAADGIYCPETRLVGAGRDEMITTRIEVRSGEVVGE